MNTCLLAIDECKGTKSTDIFSLTGVAIPIEKANILREELYNFLHMASSFQPNALTKLPEIHGSSMLQVKRSRKGTYEDLSWATKEAKLAAFAKIVDLVNMHKLRVFRVAYVKESLAFLGEDTRAYHGLCFSGLMFMIQPILASSIMIPLVDGFDVINEYSATVKFMDTVRAHPTADEHMLSLHYSQNLLEPVFGDSRYSTLIQMADVLSYIFHMRDRIDTESAIGEFQKKVANLSDALDSELINAPPAIRMKQIEDGADTVSI